MGADVEAIAVVQECIEAFNHDDRSRFKHALGRNVVERDDVAGFVIKGRAAVTAAIWALRDLFPGMRGRVRAVGIDDNTVLVEVSVEETVEQLWESTDAMTSPTVDSIDPDYVMCQVRRGKIVHIMHHVAIAGPAYPWQGITRCKCCPANRSSWGSS